MHCLLIEITRSQSGLPNRAHRNNIECDVISIGRSAECNIHLQDHRIGLHHAYIRHASDGKLYIDSKNTPLQIDGSQVHSTAISIGMQIQLGPYLFTVEALNEAYQLTLTYELLQAQQEIDAELKDWQPKPLTSKWLTKRSAAWVMFSVIILSFLLLPIMQATNPALQNLLKKINLNPHQSWSSGALSNAHRGSSTTCMDCHSVPFKTVNKNGCIKCHTETKKHGAHIAANQNIAKEIECTECHREHQGGPSMPNRSETECVNCHANINRHQVNSKLYDKLPDIHDFSQDHPDFKLSILTETGVNRVPQNAITQSTQTKEDSGLKFPHSQHTGLVEGPGGMSDIRNMQCTNCHTPITANQKFKPINFKQHCFECHRDQMEFSPKVENRLLPHSNTNELTSTLNDYYAALAFKTKQSTEWVNSELTKTRKSLSEDTGCGYCHETRPSTDKNKQNLFEIKPTLMNQYWFPAAKFPHDRHTTSKCETCHDIEKSESSADISIPNKQVCLKCHAGTKPTTNKINSSCKYCHTFHSN